MKNQGITMERELRVLLVEDSEDDAELVLRSLRTGGFKVHVQRVETAADLVQALETAPWDVVISDYSLPAFSAPEALDVVKASGRDLPFIIVSGTIGEDVAVQSLRAGAHDFLIKGQLARLVPAVERELRDAAVRSEQRHMKQQLVLVDRMVSMGTLAAGVAHEINNPLAAVLSNIEYIEGELSALATSLVGQDERRLADVREATKDAHLAADRVRLIVRDLKLFSRPDEERRASLDLHRVLDSTLRMAENELRHRARLVKDYGQIGAVEGNEARLGQVFLNLVINAAQAMPEGNIQDNEIRIGTRLVGNRVLVEVKDSGGGIPPALLPHVFEPFFTTKPVGVGTGLGLAICHRIVTSMGGDISVDSIPGRGTTFQVTFPMTKRPSENVPVIGHAPHVRDEHRASILAIDDEAIVGAAIRRMLAAEHDVIALTDARVALERLAGGDRFDVILCDLLMPSMGGPELYSELLDVAPQQAERMVFMTGGAFTPASRAFLDKVTNPRLEKPFDITELNKIVKTLSLSARP